MRQSDKCGSVRNDEIFNLHLGSGAVFKKNMNIQPSRKYGLSPEEVKSHALKSERFRMLYNMHRIEKTVKLNIRMDRYDQKKKKKKKKTKRKFKHW